MRKGRSTKEAPGHGPLTSQQTSVLALAANGLNDKDIAHQLGIRERTVRSHFAGIRARLGASTRTQAVAIAVSRGLVQTRERSIDQAGANLTGRF